jgi:hypothetical protein
MNAASNRFRTTSQRDADMFQAAGDSLAEQIKAPGLRRSLADAMSRFSTANSRGMTSSQTRQMMDAVGAVLPQMQSPARLQTPYNRAMFGPPTEYAPEVLGLPSRRKTPFNYGLYEEDEEDE